jgi:hypothetical protein
MSLKGQKTKSTSMDWNDFKSLISRLERDGEYKFSLLISVGVFTGLRISDLLQLKYSQFEETDILTVTEIKTKKQRIIKINQDLKEIVFRIKSKLNIVDSHQFIFLNKYGTKPIDKSYVNVKLKEIFKKYNVINPGGSHFFRKTLSRRVLELNNYSNQSYYFLLEMLNHSSLAMTKKYLGIREKEIHDVYDSVRL